MMRIRSIVLAAIMACFALTHAAHATTFSGHLHGYRIDLPDGWIEIPYEVIRETFANAAVPGSSVKLEFDAGFQLETEERWLAYPYVVVQVMRYQAFGMTSQPRDEDLPMIVGSMTGIDVNQVLRDTVSQETNGLIGDFTFTQPVLEPARRRYLWDTKMDVQGVGPVRGLMIGHFGRDAIVQVMFYATPDDWDAHAADRQAIIDSFRFTESKAYDESLAAQSLAGKRGFSWVSPISGAVAGIVVGFLIWLKRRNT